MRLRAVMVGCLAIALGAPAALAAARFAHPHAQPNPCTPWSVRPVLSGEGWLEFLAFDGRGSMTLSAQTQGKLLRVSPSGQVSTLVAPVSFPGGQVRRGGFLYFETGDIVPLAPTGTIDRLDLRTGQLSTWASGLTMPNGMALLPDGDAVTTGAVPSSIGLTRVPARDPSHPKFAWAKVSDTNGIAVDPSGRWLYVDRDPPASSDGEVDRVQISDPSRVEAVGELGPGTFPDDMSIDRNGVLYIAAFGAGKIYRLDPRTHTSCAIASGLDTPTYAVFGGRGWNPNDLYVPSAAGYVYQLTPPRR